MLRVKLGRNLLILYLVVFTTTLLNAQLKLPYFFSDDMVLQQQTNANIWGWAKAGVTIKVTTSWNNQHFTTQTNADGKWQLKVPTPTAGGPYELTISDGKPITLHDVMIGEVWLCSGQSNMEMPMKGFKNSPIIGSNEAILHSTNKNIRLFTVPRSGKKNPQDTVKSSQWMLASPESVSNFSATAYFFGRELNTMLNVPIGLINVSYGGSFAQAWMSAKTLQPFDELKDAPKSDTIKIPNRTVTALYNGMLHPVIGFTIKGTIWYQGETNYDFPDQYEKLFPAMVKEWRSEWGIGDFPFYFAQIAPYDYAQLPPYNAGGKFNSAYLRDAQRNSLKTIPNSGMVSLMDIGEQKSIHPMHKQEGGERFAMLALGETYGKKGFGFACPAYDSMNVSGNIVNLVFHNTPNGLTSFGKDLSQFEIAGTDKYYVPAQAVITAKGVAVSSPNVKQPVAVRYAFKDFVLGDLFSTEGLPVSSFRTDKW